LTRVLALSHRICQQREFLAVAEKGAMLLVGFAAPSAGGAPPTGVDLFG